jgi:type IV pilus assembly protein PilB
MEPSANDVKDWLEGCDPLGKALLRRGVLDPQALLEVLELQKHAPRPLDQLLVECRLATEVQVGEARAELMKRPFVDVAGLACTTEQLDLVPESFARKYSVLPLRREGRRLHVVMANPLDLDAIRDLSFATGCSIAPALGVAAHLQEAIQRFYSRHMEGAGALMAAGSTGQDDPYYVRWGQSSTLEANAEDGPVIQLLNLILRKAIQLGASDIHIEPGVAEGIVRFRLDGLLVDQLAVPYQLHPALLSRLKILGRMDIADRRLPQDGSVRVKLEEDREVDLRLSTIPLRAGEKAVIRILDASSGAFELERIGFTAEDMGKVQNLIHRHMGMIIMTGPTGSGKTTTLYSMLNRIKNRTINIVTVEDPIEYNYPGLNQIQVNADIGLTFASGLRSILRQDPDVILVGEIRDAETAEIACRAALTGHLVFSTLHTNDAPSSITRLLDIGVPRYLVASVLSGIIAQRLVRRVCPDCARPVEPDAERFQSLRLAPGSLAGGEYRLGAGCSHCHDTGYRGRMGVFETLVLDNRLRDLILRGASEEDLRLAAQESGMKTLMEDGLDKAGKGLTTLDELNRVLEVGEYTANSCGRCGRLLNSEYRFCPYCRTVQHRVCGHCGRTLQGGWRICAYCGEGGEDS